MGLKRGLLLAARIVTDSGPDGHPDVPNGLSLRKIHNAVSCRRIVDVRPEIQACTQSAASFSVVIAVAASKGKKYPK